VKLTDFGIAFSGIPRSPTPAATRARRAPPRPSSSAALDPAVVGSQLDAECHPQRQRSGRTARRSRFDQEWAGGDLAVVAGEATEAEIVAYTDDQGRFEIAGAPLGGAWLMINQPYYVPLTECP
jgi:hypothetical protein